VLHGTAASTYHRTASVSPYMTQNLTANLSVDTAYVHRTSATSTPTVQVTASGTAQSGVPYSSCAGGGGGGAGAGMSNQPILPSQCIHKDAPPRSYATVRQSWNRAATCARQSTLPTRPRATFCNVTRARARW